MIFRDISLPPAEGQTPAVRSHGLPVLFARGSLAAALLDKRGWLP